MQCKKERHHTHSGHLDLLQIPRVSIPLVAVRSLCWDLSNSGSSFVLDVLDRPDGAAHLGGYCLLVMMAAAQAMLVLNQEGKGGG